MKKFLLAMLACGVALSGLQAQRRCSTMENQARLEAMDPNLASVRSRIEAETQAFTDAFNDSDHDVVYTIPVVVHVVYNNSTQNISDAQIQSQITILNNDFRRLNADKVNTPAAWTSIAADCEINFCLATTDPNGAATTGITRTQTTATSFVDDDRVKSNATGGKDAWNTTKYLNLWVCNLGGGLLGYAQFPGGPTSTDGVVINYTAFGNTGTATAPFNKGRTATHEVGHWLNLFHIWGDDDLNDDGICSPASECSGTDNVTDTPNQCVMKYGVPTGVVTDGCTSTSPGIMYMNYMDYTDDAAMNMFTTGQKARMVATMTGSRSGLQTSTGCSGSNPTYCASSGGSTADEWIASVVVGSYSNNSGNNNGYGNYTTANVSLAKGVATNFTLTPGYSASAYPEYWKIWIDLNNDKDFADAGELVYNAGTTSTTARTGSFTVPSTATATTTRMRISMKYNAAQTECESFSYGEVEDYGVTLTSGAACGNPSGLSAGSLTSSGATLSWTAVGGATSYNIQYRVNGTTTWTTTTSTTNSRSLTGLAASTTYNWQVQAVCGGGSSAYVAGTNFTTSSTVCTDTYEANETAGTAKTISVNTNISNAKICTATDIDWFKFTTLSTSPKVRITLTTLPADYDVYLYNSTGATELGSSENGSTTSETIILNATTGATYTVKVVGFSGAFSTTANYTLRASTQSANWRDSGPVASVAKDAIAVDEDMMEIWPNPVAQNLFVNYLTNVEGDATVMIMDLSGRTLVNRPVSLNAGANTMDFDISDLANGMYIVRVQTSTQTRNAKVQIIK